MSNRYKITIEYMGSGYQGWQRQEVAPSIQQRLEEAIFEFSKEETILYAAGRTDAGVHAYGQVAHFDLEEYFDPYKLTASLNYFLKGSNIGILKVESVDLDFHSRFSAKQRHYVYKILNRRAISIIDSRHKTWIKEELDIDKMIEASKYLIGQHDFTSFRSSICQSNSPLKTIDDIKIFKQNEDIKIYVSALSFLHHMVRNIVGTLIQIGKSEMPATRMKEILEAKDRAAAGPTSPAHGLYFLKVDY